MKKTSHYNNLLEILKSGREYCFAFIGDSITSAEWVHPNWRGVFEYVLKFSFTEFTGDNWWIPEWNLKFYNYALDGASTRDFLSQTDKMLSEVKVDCVIVMGTCNDVELGIDMSEHISNLRRLFIKLSKSCDLFVYSPDIYSADADHNKSYVPYMKSALEIPLVHKQININGFKIFSQYDWKNFYTLEKALSELSVEEKNRLEKEGFRAIDNVHPNALGNVYVAKMFLEEIYGIKVNPEKYLNDLRSDKIKYPSFE